jgi:hypothetical protein
MTFNETLKIFKNPHPTPLPEGEGILQYIAKQRDMSIQTVE